MVVGNMNVLSVTAASCQECLLICLVGGNIYETGGGWKKNTHTIYITHLTRGRGPFWCSIAWGGNWFSPSSGVFIILIGVSLMVPRYTQSGNSIIQSLKSLHFEWEGTMNKPWRPLVKCLRYSICQCVN